MEGVAVGGGGCTGEADEGLEALLVAVKEGLRVPVLDEAIRARAEPASDDLPARRVEREPIPLALRVAPRPEGLRPGSHGVEVGVEGATHPRRQLLVVMRQVEDETQHARGGSVHRLILS